MSQLPESAVRRPDIRSGRLSADDYIANFSDLHPPLTRHEAFVEAERCYFCHDAPCVTACPTSIDIPMFIRQIAGDRPEGAAKTIFDQNILGGMCARVCPTETLCEEVCVREIAEGKPVKIGQLQRYATDTAMADWTEHPYQRAASTGKSVAVVGGGPAGLSCAHRLALYGHNVILYEAQQKLGGLNEFGIAAYKTVDGFASLEVDFVLGIGGITVETGKALGTEVTLGDLRSWHDAVFLAMGLPGVRALDLTHEDAAGVGDAVSFIADLRQTDDLATLPVGRKIVVIGGGMTAIDIASQTKRLGAEDVTIVYRRGQDRMNASEYEQELAKIDGVKIKHNAQPRELIVDDDAVTGIVFEYTQEIDGKLAGTCETFTLAADMVFKAIGQSFDNQPLYEEIESVALDGGRIKVDDERRTNVDGLWAGGDCVAGGDDLTVTAVEDGKIAAESIHRALIG